MSNDESFVREESLGAKTGAFAVNARLLLSLPLFLKILPVSLVFIVLASGIPSFFRWYAGSYATGSASRLLPYLNWKVAIGLGGLIVVALSGALSRILAWAFFEISGMWSAQGIHLAMVRGLGRARTTFYDENPSGRLINRLVRDYDEVRTTAIIFIGDLINGCVEMLAVSFLALIVSPWAALGIVPLLLVFSYIQWQRSAILDHARGLAAVSVGKVLDRNTDLIDGREIFLLYGRAERLLSRMASSYRDYTRASALRFMIENWSSLWIRISAEVFALFVLLFLVSFLSRGRMDIAVAGVVISALFGIRGNIGWLDHATSQVAGTLPHLRRVFEFVDLPAEEDQERARSVRSAVAPSGKQIRRPSGGTIRFEGYTMSYRPDSPVILRALDLVIPEGSKTALVGRTGSGKTSLVQALFRMVHVHSGDIRIGEQSIFDMEVEAGRALFGVVPQAPYLFAGDLRANLDRAGTLPKLALQEALESVGLAFRLDHPIVEGGQNLSVGERQLVCLARVIAANRPFVLMDEPTSGLDPETDARIHRILKSALAGRTVLTIAHRRESLGSYDRVVEMSEGRIIWQGAPAELLRR